MQCVIKAKKIICSHAILALISLHNSISFGENEACMKKTQCKHSLTLHVRVVCIALGPLIRFIGASWFCDLYRPWHGIFVSSGRLS